MFDGVRPVDPDGVSLIDPELVSYPATARSAVASVLAGQAGGGPAATRLRTWICRRDAVLTGQSADICGAKGREALDLGRSDVGAQRGNDGIDQRLARFFVGRLGVSISLGRGG
jgi:hypothetical protein